MATTSNVFAYLCQEPVWNSSQSWNTDTPNLSRCFRRTALLWIPSAFLFIAGLSTLLGGYAKKPRNATVKLLSLKLTILVISISIAIVQFAVVLSPTKVPNDYMYLTVLVSTLLFDGFLSVHQWKKRKHTSCVQFLFWLLMVACFCPTIKANEDPLDIGLFLCYLTLFCSNVISDHPSSADSSEYSEEKSSFLGRLLFLWQERLFWKGYFLKRNMELSDLPEVSDDMKLDAIVKRYDKRKGFRHDKLWKSLIKAFYSDFVYSTALKLLSVLLTFTAPPLLRLLILSTESRFQWHGYWWAFLIWISSSVQLLISHHSFHYMYKIGFKIRTVLMSSVYRKVLTVSNESRSEYTAGQISNLMSIDCQRFLDLSPHVPMFLGFPLQVILSIYLLYDMIGTSSFVGMAVLLLSVPINFMATSYEAKIQRRLLKAKDKRILLLSQVIEGIRVIKSYAWELPFIKKLLLIRETEIKCLRLKGIIWAFLNTTFANSALLGTLAAFSWLSYYENKTLTAAEVFPVLTIFNIMRTPLAFMPPFIREMVNTSISFKRLQAFLNSQDISKTVVKDEVSDPSNAIEIENADLGWTSQQPPFFENFTLKIPKGSLVAVIGTIGSGKSSLLNAVLGEMNLIKGSVRVTGHRRKVAYVPQRAWIQNMSIRDNVLFGKKMNPDRYRQSLQDSSLMEDLRMMESGDATEIGENGINLSGGQKQRVSICRAIYNDPDIILMDDPLSAVDVHVAEHLFDNVIGPEGCLKGKTRIVVTHNLSFLSQMDKILLLEKGKIVEIGTYDELSESSKFQDFCRSHRLKNEKGEESSSSSSSSSSSISLAGSPLFQDEDGDNQLIKAEEIKKGRVSFKVYIDFFRKCGKKYVFLIVAAFILCEAIHTFNNLVLTFWTDDVGSYEKSLPPSNIHDKYIALYGSTIAVAVVIDFLREYFVMSRCAEASKNVHYSVLESVMHSPVSFFDSTPIGRIINRMSSDMDVVDNKIPTQLTDSAWCLVQVVFVFGVIGYYNPVILTVYVPVGIAFVFFSQYYTITKQKLKRLEAVQKSPIFAQFGETISGSSSIRAYGVQDRFIGRSDERVGNHLICSYINTVSVRWLSSRVDLLGAFIISSSSFFVVLFRESLSPGIIGLIVSNGFMLIDNYAWTIRMICELEGDSVSLERLREYEKLKPEGEWYKPDEDRDWNLDSPNDKDLNEIATIEFKNYSTRYRPDCRDVLHKISLKISSGEKIGICGRTGAGKSSLASALLRTLEPTSGHIYISNKDISQLGLQTLRSHITIIPQDPVLFSGTLRFNLDPMESFKDDQIWTALEHAHLSDTVKNYNLGLYHKVEEGGLNLSLGQRQLICLARALLRNSKILIMDEATAAMDSNTDVAIQGTLKTAFRDCTVITIAHRLHTILNSDRVLVLNQGQIEECDSPSNLIDKVDSVFRDMLESAGILNL